MFESQNEPATIINPCMRQQPYLYITEFDDLTR
jgi:hypothetical protein